MDRVIARALGDLYPAVVVVLCVLILKTNFFLVATGGCVTLNQYGVRYFEKIILFLAAPPTVPLPTNC